MATQTVDDRGVPAFFRARVEEAKTGGTSGYRTAGYELMRHVVDLVGGEDDSKYDRLDDLAERAKTSGGAGVLNWFQTELPAYMERIPTRRLPQFLSGLLQAFDDEGGVPGLAS